MRNRFVRSSPIGSFVTQDYRCRRFTGKQPAGMRSFFRRRFPRIGAFPHEAPAPPSRQRRRPMLGPVMNRDSTGNADTSPADVRMPPNRGPSFRSVRTRDHRAGLPDLGCRTASGGMFGRGFRACEFRHPSGPGSSSPSSRRSFHGPVSTAHSVVSPPADPRDAMHSFTKPIHDRSEASRLHRDARLPERWRARQWIPGTREHCRASPRA